MTDPTWRDLDLRPAPPGWRVWWITDGVAWWVPMVGWLVQERARAVSRRVVAAVQERSGRVAAADGAWWVVGPGEPDPTPEQQAAAASSMAAVY